MLAPYLYLTGFRGAAGGGATQQDLALGQDLAMGCRGWWGTPQVCVGESYQKEGGQVTRDEGGGRGPCPLAHS